MHTPDQLLEKLTKLPPRRPGATGEQLLQNRRRAEMRAALHSAVKRKETTSTTLMSVKG